MKTQTKSRGFTYDDHLSIPLLGVGPRHIQEWFEDQVTEIVQKTLVQFLDLENETICRIQNEWGDWDDC